MVGSRVYRALLGPLGKGLGLRGLGFHSTQV